MAIYYTDALQDALGDFIVEFTEEFDWWKSDFGNREYSSAIFGKDSSYERVLVSGKAFVLRHVHLTPTDPDALAVWNRRWKQRSRKTSDRALVYVSDGKEDHLLIAVLDEPDAHAIAEMKTPADRATMEDLADCADEFLCGQRSKFRAA
ncbi:type II toxin-antitoxin system YafO family toxin [Pseudomonas sp. CGJS7]|uniref:type II toxin-antitoxin system YafO family toxin n=1 Tax=Pseudomonas sp. CGJS7 TaxID=3109348 RepID=UPI00300BE3CD